MYELRMVNEYRMWSMEKREPAENNDFYKVGIIILLCKVPKWGYQLSPKKCDMDSHENSMSFHATNPRPFAPNPCQIPWLVHVTYPGFIRSPCKNMTWILRKFKSRNFHGLLMLFLVFIGPRRSQLDALPRYTLWCMKFPSSSLIEIGWFVIRNKYGWAFK